MRCCAGYRQLHEQQRGSALLLALIFMVALARIALSAVDAALLGTSLTLNHREHDRVFHTAEALLFALDFSLLARIEADGLHVTLSTLSGSGVAIAMSPGMIEQSGAASASYQAEAAAYPLIFTAAPTGTARCGLLYQLAVQATGVRPGTRVGLSLARRVCCVDAPACEAGDFVSTSRQWRRLD